MVNSLTAVLISMVECLCGPSDEFMQADSGKLEDSDSPILRSNEEEMEYDDYMDRVPDSSWTVPQIPSPPTASGLNWPKNPRYSFDNALFVPDIGFTSMQHPQNSSNFSRPWNHH